MNKISIYVNYFSAAHLLKSQCLVPLQNGKELSKQSLPMIGDNTGNNISQKNPSYCELTGQYWVWKNDLDSDYIGFVHYRRLFDFYPDLKNRTVEDTGVIMEQCFTEEMLDRYGLNDEGIRQCIDGYDIILPERWDVTKTGGRNIYEQYKTAPSHHIRDLELAGEIINNLFPSYYVDFKTAMGSRTGFFTNMFVFKRELFEEYCAWLFSILDKLDANIDTTNYDASECRVIGYIAERLLGVFVTHQMRTRPDLRVRYLRRVFVRDTKPQGVCPPVPITNLPIVSLVASTDHNYVPHMGALIASVFSNASHEYFIDFLILDGGMTSDDHRGLRLLERLHPNAKISFIDMSMQFLDVETHMYFTRATFYRLALPELVRDRSKVLFLDTDVVVLDDVSKLFNAELRGKAIAAVNDLIMRSFAIQGVRSIAPVGGKPTINYLSEYVGMGDKYNEYFQAGVILFDLDRLRSDNTSETMTADLRNRRYWFLDQDVLNRHFLGNVEYLESKWNCVYLPPDLLEMLPLKCKRDYDQSVGSPSIIHYAGDKKPWDNFDTFFAHYYWYYLRMTCWYERVVAKNSIYLPSPSDKSKSRRGGSLKRRAASIIWRSMPGLVRRRLWNTAVALDRRW